MSEKITAEISKELKIYDDAKVFWFTMRIVLLLVAVASTAILATLQPEDLPLPVNIVALIGFLSISIYIATAPEKRYLALNEAYLSLRSDIGKCNMNQIDSEELIERWSRIDERLYSKLGSS